MPPLNPPKHDGGLKGGEAPLPKKRQHHPPLPPPPPPPNSQLLELLNARAFKTCSGGQEAVEAAMQTNDLFAPVFAKAGVHISDSNPFNKINRRLKHAEEKISRQSKKIRRLERAASAGGEAAV